MAIAATLMHEFFSTIIIIITYSHHGCYIKNNISKMPF